MSNRGPKHRDEIKQTKEAEGEERPTVFVQIFAPTGGVCTLLCYTWGIIDGVKFFDTIEGTHVEMHGDFQYLVQCPLHGYTFNQDGTLRAIQKEVSVLAVN